MVSSAASTARALEAVPARSRPRRRHSRLKVLFGAIDPMRLGGAALFVAIWQAITYMLPPVILPTPLGVLYRAGADFWSAPALSFYGVADANLYANLIYTAENVVVAVLIGTAIGVAGGLISARFSLFRAVVDPMVMTMGTVPILIAAPFLLIWFGATRASAVSLVTFYVIVILYIFAQRAATNLDPIFEQYARTFGATKGAMVRDILVPATVPEILGGFRIALAGAWGLEAISELLGSQSGIGKVLEVLAGATDAQGIMACLLLLGVTGIVADALAALVIARVAAWSAPAL
jgi:ABC-type nitrate/sulfonate/bicarbonate transport system permease component